MRIRYPNGVEAAGEVIAIEPPARIVFSYGYASGEPIPPGASRVTIELVEDPAGTRLSLRHAFAEATVRDHHVQGWRYQLALFANVVADEAFAGAAERIDAWCAAWGERDEAGRRAAFAALATGGVTFRDRYASWRGSTSWWRTSAPSSSSSRARGSNAAATCVTARAPPSPTGARAPPTEPRSAAAPTSIASPPTAGSRPSSDSGRRPRRADPGPTDFPAGTLR